MPLSQQSGSASTTTSPIRKVPEQQQTTSEDVHRAKVQLEKAHESEKQQAAALQKEQRDHEDSVDEFFNTLSGSDNEYFSDPHKHVTVSDSSSLATKQHAPSTSTPRNTPVSTANIPTVSESGEVSAVAMAPHSGGASEGSFHTESLTTPPDMARDAETVSSVGMSIDVDSSGSAVPVNPVHTPPVSLPAGATGDGVEEERVPVSTHSTAAPAPATESATPTPAPTPASKSPSITSTASPKKSKHRVGRPKKHKDGTSKAWSFKCKCGETCSSYENQLYQMTLSHPKTIFIGHKI